MEARRGIEVYLVRHADAGDPAKWEGSDDVRPLSEKGRRQAERLAAFLVRCGFDPDLIVTSPKVRARETAEIVAAAIDCEVTVDDLLGGPFGSGELAAIVEDHGRPVRPLLVGHDPDFSELLAELCAAEELPMRKGALARVDIVRSISAGGGVLRWLIPPDALKSR